ncbi:MAG: putative porin [Acidobacteriota bacterium]
MRSVYLPCFLGLLLALPAHGQAAQENAPEDTAPKFRVWGDLRLRGELDRDRRGAPDRERARVRFRVGAERQLASGLTFGARLVTAPDPDDPNSTHQNLGTGFRNFRIALDRAYVRWTPSTPWPLALVAGKFEPPFLTAPVFRELVWDADIQPEGAAVVLEPLSQLRLVGGGYVLLHQGSGKDVNVGVAQAAGRLSRGSALQVTAALGVHIYGSADQSAARRLARDNQGNALVTDADGDTVAFASKFQVWNGYAAITYAGSRVPAEAVIEYMVNTSGAAGFDDDGIAVGARVGRLGEPGRWRVDYQYQSIGREAIYSPVAQDDFLDATNFRGHLLGLAFQYLPTANVYIWTLWSARNEPREETFQKRFRLDLNFWWRLR